MEFGGCSLNRLPIVARMMLALKLTNVQMVLSITLQIESLIFTSLT